MRAALAGFLIITALTSCTGSPASRTPAARTPEARTPETAGDSPTEKAIPAAPASLPCGAGQQVRVNGARRNVLAGLVTRPLTVPPPRDHRNKILWQTTQPGPGDLVISASLNGSDRLVQRRVEGGPGPSIINMPKAGCWTFSLTWSGSHDVLAIRYIRRA